MAVLNQVNVGLQLKLPFGGTTSKVSLDSHEPRQQRTSVERVIERDVIAYL